MTHPLFVARSVPVPAASRIRDAYPHPDLADAFAIDLPPTATGDPECLAHRLFDEPPPAVEQLMRLRDRMVSVFGLKTAVQLRRSGGTGSVDRINLFRVYGRYADEIVLGEDDAHLDFRLSVRCEPSAGAPDGRRVVVSTVVQCHNRLGRSYLLLISPFHRWVAKTTLRRASRRGWPSVQP